MKLCARIGVVLWMVACKPADPANDEEPKDSGLLPECAQGAPIYTGSASVTWCMQAESGAQALEEGVEQGLAAWEMATPEVTLFSEVACSEADQVPCTWELNALAAGCGAHRATRQQAPTRSRSSLRCHWGCERSMSRCTIGRRVCPVR